MEDGAAALIQVTLLGEAVDGAPTAVFVADETLRYIAVNRYACELLGYSRDELLQLRVTDVATYDEADSEFRDMIQAGVRSGTSTLRRKDGSTFDLRYRAGQTTVAGMTVYVSVGAPA